MLLLHRCCHQRAIFFLLDARDADEYAIKLNFNNRLVTVSCIKFEGRNSRKCECFIPNAENFGKVMRKNHPESAFDCQSFSSGRFLECK